jgi:hypothetical protein
MVIVLPLMPVRSSLPRVRGRASAVFAKVVDAAPVHQRRVFVLVGKTQSLTARPDAEKA